MYAQAEVNMVHPCKYVILGKSGSGKSTLLVYLIDTLFRGQVDRGIAVCPTFHDQELFDPIRNMFSDVDVYEGTDNNPFDDIMKRLMDEKKIARESGSPQVRSLIIVDDMAGSNVIHNNRKGTFSRLAVQLKNFNLSMFVLIQGEKQVDPNYRENLSGLIIYPTQCIQDLITWIFKSQNTNGCSKPEIESIVWTAFLNMKQEGYKEEFGKNFLFILTRDRTFARYFVNFTHEMHPKVNTPRMMIMNS